MDHVARLGTGASVSSSPRSLLSGETDICCDSNVDDPRIASSSKDATVRIWNSKTRALEFTLGSHTASVNCVRWGGEGVIYTASSDRTVKLWSGKDVGGADHRMSRHC